MIRVYDVEKNLKLARVAKVKLWNARSAAAADQIHYRYTMADLFE